MNATKNWSSYQLAVFAWVENPSETVRNLIVQALAGTGKTTTVVEAINRAPEASILATAFNTKNAEDLQAKITNPNADAKTFHSLGFAICRRYLNNPRVDTERGNRMATAACGVEAPGAMINLVARLASKGKCVLPSGKTSVMVDLAFEHDLAPDAEWEEDGWTVTRVAECALKAMELARTTRDGTVDYDDMVYLPVANRWVAPKYDMVIIDEAQDTNASQLRLAMGLCKKGGRIIVVGDRNQAIYAFRGADMKSMDRLKTELNATELTLPVTYRCGKKIVELAKEIVPGYIAADSNGEGEILDMVKEQALQAAVPGDFVISRKNAPLTGICLSFLKMGKRAKVEGKDIGRGLISMIKKFKAKSMPDLLKKLAKWEEKEMARAGMAAKDEEAAAKKQAEIADKAECVRTLAEGMASVTELTSRIEDLFEDRVGAGFITCMTTHKAKGREADTCFLLEETFTDRNQEEKNIRYVAITRAKSKLVWVQEPVTTVKP